MVYRQLFSRRRIVASAVAVTMGVGIAKPNSAQSADEKSDSEQVSGKVARLTAASHGLHLSLDGKRFYTSNSSALEALIVAAFVNDLELSISARPDGQVITATIKK